MTEVNINNTKINLNLLHKLSLIVPTRDRNYYLSRWLWYTSKYQFGKIIIADSSSDDKKKINQDIIRDVIKKTGSNIQYINCTPETDPLGGDVLRKWGLGLQYVETEYCKMCTDKEFVFPKALVDCVEYLDSNPDYIAAEGIVYNVTKTKGKSSDCYPELRYPTRRTETSSSSLERYKDAFVSQRPWGNNMLVAVIRIDVNKYLYQLLNKYNIYGIRYSEIILGYVGYLVGKYYYSPYLDFSIIDNYHSNDNHSKILNNRGTKESCSSRYPCFDDYIRNGTSNEYYECYKCCMIEQITRFTDLNIDTAEQFVLSTITQELLYNYSHNVRCNSNLLKLIRILNNRNCLLTMWFAIPINLRIRIQSIISQRLDIMLPINKIIVPKPYSPEIEIVLQCIKQTTHLHKLDTPLFESPFSNINTK